MLACLWFALAACAQRPASDVHDTHAVPPASVVAGAPAAAAMPASDTGIPPGAAGAAARLESSPRHGEWVMVPSGAGDSVRAWIVYPERRTSAPVVVVVQEIFGLTSWIRGVADQLAADGFIAIAPDLLYGQPGIGNPDSLTMDAARAATAKLDREQVLRRIAAVADYGTSRPAALPKVGVVGFCWGGGMVWRYAARFPATAAAVSFYGGVPEGVLTDVRTPVLGLYGENDQRVNATIAPTDSAMRALGRTYEPHVFPGAGHGFLRQQDGANGANLAASRAAWPLAREWFRRHLGA
jgi:carboxymethylenebutenolidase